MLELFSEIVFILCGLFGFAILVMCTAVYLMEYIADHSEPEDPNDVVNKQFDKIVNRK